MSAAQRDLFAEAPAEAKALRDAGFAQVLDAFTASLMDHVVLAIHRLARSGAPFTSDDVYARLRPEARAALAAHPNAIGALMQQAARRREIQKTGAYVQSTRPERRAGTVAVWRGEDP